MPTGLVADVYSRRLSIIIGYFLVGAGFIVEGAFPVLGAILVAQVIWGVGFTFTSGAQQAWLSDELGGQGVGRIFLRGAQAAQVGGIIGIGIGVALGSIALGLPLVVAGLAMISLGIFLMFVMPETGFSPARGEDRQTWQVMGQTLRDGVSAFRIRPTLAIILAVTIIYGAASEPIDRLWPLHLLTNFTFPTVGGLDNVVWFGIIGVGTQVLGIVATELISRRFDVDDSRSAAMILFVLNALHIGSILVIALAGSFALAVSLFLVSGMIRRVTDPVMDAWTNQHVDSGVCATVFSMRGQGDAIGQIAFGPVMGAIATITTLRIALVGVAAMLVPPQALFLFTRRRKVDEES